MNNISFIYDYIDLNATICYFVYNIVFIFLFRYRMGAWFSSRSQPLSFNTNELHGYKSPPKKPLKENNNNNNNTRRNKYNFLGASLKHNTRKNTPAFVTLLTSGVVPKRNITNYTAPSYLNIPSIPNVVITKNIINHRHKKLKRLFSHLGI